MKVVKRIGQGGFGNVDQVVLDNGEVCARKEFSQNQPLSAELLNSVRKRFAKEVKVQSAIDHPNIVSILASDLGVDPPYYLMPLAESSLDNDLSIDRTLGGKFVSALSDIVAALEELHSMQVYHRDLKPQNVLRFDRNDKSVYALSDFGLISMKESNLSELTKTGMGKSSDFYTAAEISSNLRKASAQSDVYSLGCILHDMVGAEVRVPFQEIKEKGEFGPILAGCTKNDSSKRFASARSVLDAVLTVEYVPTGTVSAGSENFLDMLSTENALEPEKWRQLANYLEDSASTADVSAICGKLTAEKIKALCETEVESAERIGIIFGAWVFETPFNFELCDAVANRVEVFYANCDFAVKVECLMALLEMGTNHNRWYVERKFVQLCGPEMSENLAKRLVIRFHLAKREHLCASIVHLENSIGFKRENLHSKLFKALESFCS